MDNSFIKTFEDWLICLYMLDTYSHVIEGETGFNILREKFYKGFCEELRGMGE